MYTPRGDNSSRNGGLRARSASDGALLSTPGTPVTPGNLSASASGGGSAMSGGVYASPKLTQQKSFSYLRRNLSASSSPPPSRHISTTAPTASSSLPPKMTQGGVGTWLSAGKDNSTHARRPALSRNSSNEYDNSDYDNNSEHEDIGIQLAPHFSQASPATMSEYAMTAKDVDDEFERKQREDQDVTLTVSLGSAPESEDSASQEQQPQHVRWSNAPRKRRGSSDAWTDEDGEWNELGMTADNNTPQHSNHANVNRPTPLGWRGRMMSWDGTPTRGRGVSWDGMTDVDGFDTSSHDENSFRGSFRDEEMEMEKSKEDSVHRGTVSQNSEDDRRNSSRYSKRDPDKGRWRRPIIFGMEMPFKLPVKPSWNRLSSTIVRHAPCFWCCANPLETSATDRAILYRLNILCAVFAMSQVGVGLFLMFVLIAGPSGGNEQDETNRLAPNLWNLNGSIFFLGVVGFILLVTVLCTMRVIREVNLVGAVRYMWALIWILPMEIFFVISLFDYHRVTDVWVKHWWATPSMAWFRELFCQRGTANTLCAAPTLGGKDYDSTDEWCLSIYNSTACQTLRDSAQLEMRTSTYIFFTINAICGLFLIVLLLLTLNVLGGVISTPIVQRSKESNVPAWLTLPTVGCLCGGAILLFSPSSVLNNETGTDIFWIGVTYLVSACTFFLAAVLGWTISVFPVLNSRAKKQKQIVVYMFIATMVCTVFSVAAIFVASLIYSINLVDVPLTDRLRGDIACYIDSAQSCTQCNNLDGLQECPEWSDDDVIKVIQTQLKQSATLAAIFLLYAFSSLRFGFVLRSHISRYQIDYV
eukprot:scaffold9919_cov55-Attheya_sp.AAC.1